MNDPKKIDYTPKYGIKTVEVLITMKDGTTRIEVWEGGSRRWAVMRARDYYRDDTEVRRADFASGEPI
jgi:hypothetical protein